MKVGRWNAHHARLRRRPNSETANIESSAADGSGTGAISRSFGPSLISEKRASSIAPVRREVECPVEPNVNGEEEPARPVKVVETLEVRNAPLLARPRVRPLRL